MAASSAARSHAPWIGVLAAVCLLGYAPALDGDFMLDDYVVLFGDVGLEYKSPIDLFTTPQHAYYRPVGHLFLYLCHAVFGRQPLPYHVANLAVFGAIVILAYLVFVRLAASRRIAALGAALMAVHPFHAFLVNYVTASAIASYVLLMEGSLLGLLVHFESGRRAPLVASLACFSGALLAHEGALVFPAVVLATGLSCAAPDWRRRGRMALLYAATAAFFVVLRARLWPELAAPRLASVLTLSPSEYLTTLADLLGWYFHHLLWPRHVLFLWSDTVDRDLALLKALGLAAIGGAWIWTTLRWRGHPRSFALALFGISLLPMAAASFTHYPHLEPIVEPHWFTFGSLGFFFLLAGLCAALARRLAAWLGGAVGAGILLCWLALLWSGHAPWRDEESYSRYWLQLNPRNWTPYHGLGRAYLRAGRPEAALEILEAAERRFLLPAVMRHDLDLARYRAGKEDPRLARFRRGLLGDPTRGMP